MGGGKLGLSNIGGTLVERERLAFVNRRHELRWQSAMSDVSTNLVGLVGGSSSSLALVAGSKLSEVTVVVALPGTRKSGQ